MCNFVHNMYICMHPCNIVQTSIPFTSRACSFFLPKTKSIYQKTPRDTDLKAKYKTIKITTEVCNKGQRLGLDALKGLNI